LPEALCPDLAYLLARKITERPANVKTDVELDAAAVAAPLAGEPIGTAAAADADAAPPADGPIGVAAAAAAAAPPAEEPIGVRGVAAGPLAGEAAAGVLGLVEGVALPAGPPLQLPTLLPTLL